MKKHILFIEFMLSKRADDDKRWYLYRVYGTSEAIEHYQSTHDKPLLTRETNIPLFMCSVPVGKRVQLRYSENDNRYYADQDEYKLYADTAKQHRGDKDMFKYYMDKAEECLNVVIPEELINPKAPDVEPVTTPEINKQVQTAVEGNTDDTYWNDPNDPADLNK